MMATPKHKGNNNFALIAGLVILAALFLTRGGAASLVPLMRFALPVIIVVLALRAVTGRMRSMIDQAVRQARNNVPPDQDPRQWGQGPFGQQAPGVHDTEQNDVIDLCPQCGAYKTRGHRCAKT